MAARYYGVNIGLHKTDVATGAATTSKDIEIVVANTSNLAHKAQLIDAMNYLMQSILEDTSLAT